MKKIVHKFVRAIACDVPPYEAQDGDLTVTKTIRNFRDGDLVTAAELVNGHFDSCVRMGHIQQFEIDVPDEVKTEKTKPAK